MHKYRFVVLVSLVALIATGCAPLFTTPPATTSQAPANNTIEATFVCPDGTSLDAVFDNSANNVTVTMPEGTVTLQQVESADGAKYSSGTITFWNKGDEATVEVDGKPVYQNCTTQPAGDSSSAPASDTIEATFVCPDGTSLDTVFDNSANNVTVTMPEGTVTLQQVESADGAKYSSGTITFWNKGDEATVEVDGKPVYQNCTTQPSSESSTAPTEAPADDNIIEATFVCPDGTSLDTVFDNNARTVTVALPDGTVTLPQVVSADGARYSDGTTTFWNVGNKAMVEVNGETVYQDCVAQPAS